MKIVIGQGKNKNVEKAIEILVNSNTFNSEELEIVYSSHEIMDSIENPKVDAVIRGSLSSSSLMAKLKNRFSKDLNRATYIFHNNKEFLLSPVGIDEGKTIQDKIKIVKQSSTFLNSLNKEAKIAILSGGRKDDKGRSPDIDKFIDDSQELYYLLKDDYNIKNYFILLEEAINDKCNVLICPDGIIGNYVFRTLVLVSGWESYGAITLGMDKIFIDTSRSQTVDGYIRSIKLAKKLFNLKK